MKLDGIRYRTHRVYKDNSTMPEWAQTPGDGMFLYEANTDKHLGTLNVRFRTRNNYVTPAELVEFGKWLIHQFSPANSYVVDDDTSFLPEVSPGLSHRQDTMWTDFYKSLDHNLNILGF